MKRKYKRRTSRFGIFFVFLTAVTIAGVFFIPWAMKPDNFRNEKNKINSWLNGIFFQDFYNAKSLILVDLSNDNIFISKRENEQQLPASLAKLFVIEYAATLADLDSIVPANYEAIQLTKPGSSVANIDAKKYFLHNLFAAMLVPSGNDAAYVVADYCGSILSPQAKNSQERINVFMEHLNNYLQNQGYENTILYDPSGYDVNALTTVSDLKSVSTHLLEKQWFRDIVSKSNYTATLPDGSTQTWRNTNTFLDQTSEYYNENVKGIKTGSLSNDYNLVVLYQQHGKEFLICSLGSQSDSSRYDDVNYILKTITVTVLPPLRIIRCFSICSSSPTQTDSIPTFSSVRTKSANSSPPYLPQEPFMVLVYFLSAAAISFKTRSPSSGISCTIIWIIPHIMGGITFEILKFFSYSEQKSSCFIRLPSQSPSAYAVCRCK